MFDIEYSVIKSLYLEKGYEFFEGEYNLNIGGIRSENRGSGLYDDVIFCIYEKDGKQKSHVWPATTDPLSFYLKKPVNLDGAAILVPNQYLSSYVKGKHKGKYDALVQIKPVSVYRDNNKDDLIDLVDEEIKRGMFGINIHQRFSWRKDGLDKTSAGCQAFANNENFKTFLNLIEKSIDLYGNKFSYTLFDESDLKAIIKNA